MYVCMFNVLDSINSHITFPKYITQLLSWTIIWSAYFLTIELFNKIYLYILSQHDYYDREIINNAKIRNIVKQLF